MARAEQELAEKQAELQAELEAASQEISRGPDLRGWKIYSSRLLARLSVPNVTVPPGRDTEQHLSSIIAPTSGIM